MNTLDRDRRRRRNLLRAARFLRRLDEASGGQLELEGAPAAEIAGDLQEIANELVLADAFARVMRRQRQDTFSRRVDPRALRLIPGGDRP